MKHMKLATLGVVYSVSTVLLLAFVGVIFFQESLNAYEISGIVLAIAALILLSAFS
jgi:small multidrug resistance pump